MAYTAKEQEAYDEGFADGMSDAEEMTHQLAGYIGDLVTAIRGNAKANEALDRVADHYGLAERVALSRSAA